MDIRAEADTRLRQCAIVQPGLQWGHGIADGWHHGWQMVVLKGPIRAWANTLRFVELHEWGQERIILLG